MSYEGIHKPTFTNQLLAVPPREWPHILDKPHLPARVGPASIYEA